MKKRYLLLLLILVVVITGCGKKKNKEANGDITIREEKKEEIKDVDVLDEIYLEDGEYLQYMFFSNTDQIIEPDFLPTYVLQNVTVEAQKYLISQGYPNAEELIIVDNSAEHISSIAQFKAKIDGTDKTLVVIYSFVTEKLAFEIE